MIAKASTISHGANAIRYSVNKEKADIVKANLLPDNISPEAMYGRMMVSIRPRACFFPLFSFLPLWLHYNLNPLCVQY